MKNGNGEAPAQMFFDEILVAASPEGFIVDLAQDLGWRPDEWSIRHDVDDSGTGTYLTVYNGNRSPLSFGVVRPRDLDPFFAKTGPKIDVPAMLAATRSAAPPPTRHMVLTDGDRTALFDTSTQEPLLSAATPDQFDAVIKPVLLRDRVLEGSLRDLHRKSFAVLARDLRDWTFAWEQTLVIKAGVPKAEARALLDGLVIVRALIDCEIFKPEHNATLYEAQQSAVHALTGDKRSCATAWRTFLHMLYSESGMDILHPSDTVDRAFKEGVHGADLCRSLFQQSRSKFTVPVVLESFNYGDPSDKCLVRMTPASHEEIDLYLGRQTVETTSDIGVQSHLDELGYRGVLRVFDRLLRFYSELEEMVDRHDDVSTADGQQDLLAWTNHVLARPEAFDDVPGFVMRHNFAVRVNTEHQQRILTLLLHLHVLHHHSRSKRPFRSFPPASSCVSCVVHKDVLIAR